MTTETATIDQLRERLSVYKEESQRLRQTFANKQFKNRFHSNEVQQQSGHAKAIDPQVKLEFERHLQNTQATLQKISKQKAFKIVKIVVLTCILVGVFILAVDPLAKLFFLNRMFSKYRAGNEIIPAIYFLRSASLRRAFEFSLLWFKRLFPWDWEIPS